MGGKGSSGTVEFPFHLTGGSGKLRFGRALGGRTSGHCARASVRSRHARFQSQGSPHATSTRTFRQIRCRLAQGGVAGQIAAFQGRPSPAPPTGKSISFPYESFVRTFPTSFHSYLTP